MRNADWMADTGAKTQSSDKTNPVCVSWMTLLYVNGGSSPVSHKAKGNRSQGERVRMQTSYDLQKNIPSAETKNVL